MSSNQMGPREAFDCAMACGYGNVTPELEEIISRSQFYSYEYATRIVKGKCSDVIERGMGLYSYWYAKHVVHGRCSDIIKKAVADTCNTNMIYRRFAFEFTLLCAYVEVMNGYH